MLALLLIACGANEAADLLEYPGEVEAVLADSDDQQRLSWTVDVQRDVQIHSSDLMCDGFGVLGDGAQAGFACDDFDPDGFRLLGRGDQVTFTVIADALGDQTDMQPPEQVVALSFDVWRCHGFGDACDLRDALPGTLDVLIAIP